IRGLAKEPERLKRIDAIVNWTDPGPGGFYDDLGNLANQPHLLRGPGFQKDPDFRKSSLVGFRNRLGLRTSWLTHAESIYDAPFQMRYTGLDRTCPYKIRLVYTGDNPNLRIRLVANDNIEIHPFQPRPATMWPIEFDIPPAATDKGELSLSWYPEPGRGGNGRGCTVAEIWLIKKD